MRDWQGTLSPQSNRSCGRMQQRAFTHRGINGRCEQHGETSQAPAWRSSPSIRCQPLSLSGLPEKRPLSRSLFPSLSICLFFSTTAQDTWAKWVRLGRQECGFTLKREESREASRAVGGQVRGGGTGRTAMGPTTDAVQASKRRWDLSRASKLGDSPLSGGGLCHCHFPSNSMTLTDCQQHTATVNTSPAAGFFSPPSFFLSFSLSRSLSLSSCVCHSHLPVSQQLFSPSPLMYPATPSLRLGARQV